MTRVYEIEADEFSRIQEGQQNFITLRDDKLGVKGGDTLILQHVAEGEEGYSGGGVSEVTRNVSFTYLEGLKNGYVTCGLKEPSNA